MYAADGVSHCYLWKWAEVSKSSKGRPSRKPGGKTATPSCPPIYQERDGSVIRGIAFQGAQDYGKVINLALRHPPPPPYIRQPALK